MEVNLSDLNEINCANQCFGSGSCRIRIIGPDPDPYNFFKRIIPEADLRIRIRIKMIRIRNTGANRNIGENHKPEKEFEADFRKTPILSTAVTFLFLTIQKSVILDF